MGDDLASWRQDDIAAKIGTRKSGARKVGAILRRNVCGKRLKADVSARPTRMLNGRAFVAAGRAPRALAQLVARSVGSPPDNGHGARERRPMTAFLTVDPQPWRRAL